MVTFDAAGLNEGVYTTTWRVASDIPNEPHVDVPVTLTVTPPACPAPLADVSITGPASGLSGVAYTFNAVISPSAATQPVSYTWAPAPQGGQGTASASYRWTTAGNKALTLRAANCGGGFTATHTIAIAEAAPPALSVSPQAFFYAMQVGDPARQDSIFIGNTGGGTLTWNASDDAVWLSVSPASGGAPGSLALTVDPAGLPAGAYAGRVTISAPGALHSPQVVTVSLTLEAPPPPPPTAPDLSQSGFGAQPAAVDAGQSVTFTLDLYNQGTAAAQARITATLPASLSFTGGGSGVAHAAGRVTWSGSVPAGAAVNVSWQAQAAAGTPNGAELLVPAQIAEDGTRIYARQTAVTVINAPVTYHALILTNRERLAALYGAARADAVLSSLQALAGATQGELLRLDQEPDVAAAYAAWALQPTNVTRANAVAAAIRALLLERYAQQPALKYVVIAGDDRVVPFYRAPNASGAYPESSYAGAGSSSTIGSALAADTIPTDDYYLALTPVLPAGLGHAFYLPDYAGGRLIETPEQIVAQIEAFLGGGGLNLAQAAVTGSDNPGQNWLAPYAQSLCADVQAGGVSVNCSLIGQAWSYTQFVGDIFNSRNDLVSLNQHACHSCLGTPDGTLSTAMMSPSADHSNVFLYTLGCHAGLNVPDGAPWGALDLPEAFVSKGATYVGNTGYGLGCTNTECLSNRLMRRLNAHLLNDQWQTAGEALLAAKNDYYVTEGYFNGLDERIMLQATYYGLPMRPLSSPVRQAHLALALDSLPAGARVVSTASADSLTAIELGIALPGYGQVSQAEGDYYTYRGQTLSDVGRPVQPALDMNLSIVGTRARGVVFLGGAYRQESGFGPYVEQGYGPAVSETVEITATWSYTGWTPPLPHTFNARQAKVAGAWERLVLALGQHNAQGQRQRLFTTLELKTYYGVDTADSTAPAIGALQATHSAGQVTVRAPVSDESGLYEVLVTWDEGGAWRSRAMALDGASWQASFPGDGATPFVVQAVDAAGNVALDDNDGQYYYAGAAGFKVYLPLALREG
ncbi:MAG: DUF11 domain-containing protein [Thermoflexales bacterium]|nr:DUF11 domain-containing protein [Thermoflexales bacterium]